MNAINSKALAVQVAIGFCVIATGFAGAQSDGSPRSDHSLSPLETPMPAAYQARTRQLYVGTLEGDVRKIVDSENERPRDVGRIHKSPGNAILRIRLDARRERLWILDVGNVHVYDLARNQLVRSIALPNWFYADDGSNCLPDLQLDRHGAAFVSDNVQPKLWRIDGDRFSVIERSVRLDSQRSVDAGFSALAISEGGVMFAAMAAPGSLWRIDTGSFRAERIQLNAPIHGACAMETLGGVRSGELVVFVLASGRARLDIRRIDMRPGSNQAYIGTVAPDSVVAPASLLAWRGTLHLASNGAATASSQRVQADKAPFALRPVYKSDAN